MEGGGCTCMKCLAEACHSNTNGGSTDKRCKAKQQSASPTTTHPTATGFHPSNCAPEEKATALRHHAKLLCLQDGASKEPIVWRNHREASFLNLFEAGVEAVRPRSNLPLEYNQLFCTINILGAPYVSGSLKLLGLSHERHCCQPNERKEVSRFALGVKMSP